MPATTEGSRLIATPDRRLRVFISSTLEELAPERAAVRAAVLRLRLTPVMFELGARAHPPRDLYRAYLEQSEVFVAIYGDRYGWVLLGTTVAIVATGAVGWWTAPVPGRRRTGAGAHRAERAR